MRVRTKAVNEAGSMTADQEGPGRSSRRDFLRRAGMAGALAAGLAGGAELLGMSSASAATQRRVRKVSQGRSDAPCTETYRCVQSPGKCGGPCQPSGHCCYTCTGCGVTLVGCHDTCSTSFGGCCPIP
jgi:anaerobic selenocysteine-containing dehydrogenase